MAGIVFFKTRDLRTITEFYRSQLGMSIWLDQQSCVILQHDNLLLGFCEREIVEKAGMITFFYERQEEVDAMYRKMQAQTLGEPRVNDIYRIYQFFAKDPEGRILEFQTFLHPIPAY